MKKHERFSRTSYVPVVHSLSVVPLLHVGQAEYREIIDVRQSICLRLISPLIADHSSSAQSKIP